MKTMTNNQLYNQLIDQSKDLIWMIDSNFQLVYANDSYYNFFKDVIGVERKIQDSAFIESFGKESISKWNKYYQRAFSGECFEIEEFFYHSKAHEIQYNQISFKPIFDQTGKVNAVSCQSRDITSIVQQRSHAQQLMNASLDVFCTINEEGYFVIVSDAATTLWGYTPEELLEIPYRSLILQEDVPKTDAIAADIISGKEIKTFVNRYRKKDGGIV